MPSSRSKFVSAAWVAVACAFAPTSAWAQACCAGSGVVTPGRLAMHEDALAGLQVKGASVLGAFDDDGHEASLSPGVSELDFEEDVFGAVRVLRRGQVAGYVPFAQTHRAAQGRGEFGGGLGDINVGFRYDAVFAGEYRFLPGLAILAGLTLPTGRPPEDASTPLATGATGIGAFQGTVGIALEHITGPFLFDVSAYAAKRTSRTAQGVRTSLATQWTALASAAYVFPLGAAVAASVSYAAEGDAEIDGVTASGTAHRAVTAALSGVLPVGERFRLQGSVFANPPLAGFGQNQSAAAGVTVAWVVGFW